MLFENIVNTDTAEIVISRLFCCMLDAHYL